LKNSVDGIGNLLKGVGYFFGLEWGETLSGFG